MLTRASQRVLMCGLLVLGSLPLTQPAVAAPPPDWILGAPGSPPGSPDYRASVDHTVAYDGSGSALLKSVIESPPRFGTLMQRVAGNVFAGKRIRFSAYIKADKVRKVAGLWIRAENATGQVIAFKGASFPGSRVHGTRDWTQIHIVINIPKATAAVFYGVLLNGSGAVWIDNVQFDVLGKANPNSPSPMYPAYNAPPVALHLLPRPENLNFEKKPIDAGRVGQRRHASSRSTT